MQNPGCITRFRCEEPILEFNLGILHGKHNLLMSGYVTPRRFQSIEMLQTRTPTNMSANGTNNQQRKVEPNIT